MPDVLPYIFDVPALKAWSAASANESQAVLDEIKADNILIFNRVWDGFKTAYPDEAETIPKDEFTCCRATDEHRETSAALVEKLQAHFPFAGPYDDSVEWALAGIALCGPYTIVTDERRKAKFAKIDGLIVITYEELLAAL